ncbi:hypothetical protein BT96DRAFT_916348 [Gymnopus androsaceus JB14]|uniref:Mid2 domain-containing protein n=1 Tax=Gymnopus androsaceus JB14 TaxID=1447944 RepID=A0A6A4I8Q4_9AGAR|nr:hypothetical protein BT96DRAFT_916348 [Gymnopus androsaceus JB14]
MQQWLELLPTPSLISPIPVPVLRLALALALAPVLGLGLGLDWDWDFYATATNTDTKSTGGTPTQNSPTAPPSQTVVTSIASDGSTVFATVTLSSSTSSSSSSSTSGADTSSNSDGSSGLGTGSIVGLSVAGGIAALGIVGFFVWKFTRKRFSDFDDTEAIKWPELNTHSGDGGDSHPLPVHNTGRAGFDTGSEVSLSRAPSTSNHTNFSTPDLGGDPYAVPPLPHLNPNQPGPYRDDPSAAGGYYDPYRGPVPGTFSEPGTATEWGPNHGEAYPMAQMGGAVGPSGRASPGPSMMGRMSPGPGMAYDMRGPSPQPPMPGRGSPGPQAAYDNYGR